MSFEHKLVHKVSYPPLNTNLCKFQLPHIWYEVLQDTPALHLSTLRPGYFQIFKMQRISSIYAGTQNMQAQYKQKKKLDIDGHLVSILGWCGGLERTHF